MSQLFLYLKLFAWVLNRVSYLYGSGFDLQVKRIFHLTGYNFKSSLSSSVILEYKVSCRIRKRSSFKERSFVMICYSCSIFLGEVLFPIKFAAGFVWVYYSIEMNDRASLWCLDIFFLLSHSNLVSGPLLIIWKFKENWGNARILNLIVLKRIVSKTSKLYVVPWSIFMMGNSLISFVMGFFRLVGSGKLVLIFVMCFQAYKLL